MERGLQERGDSGRVGGWGWSSGGAAGLAADGKGVFRQRENWDQTDTWQGPCRAGRGGKTPPLLPRGDGQRPEADTLRAGAWLSLAVEDAGRTYGFGLRHTGQTAMGYVVRCGCYKLLPWMTGFVTCWCRLPWVWLSRNDVARFAMPPLLALATVI